MLPSEEIIQEAIKLNLSLTIKFPDETVQFNKKDCIPYISLLMGALDADNIDKSRQILISIVKGSKPLKLEIDKIDLGIDPKDFITSTFHIKKTKELQALHETIIDNFSNLIFNNTKLENFFDYKNVEPGIVTYVNSFKEKSSFENYNPHITIGFGKIELKVPQYFEASRLAICHLGNNGTCRKILTEINL